MLLFPRSLAFFALLFASILACGQTLTMVSPKAGSTVSSPVRVVANFSSTAPVETITVLLDGVQVAQPDAVTPLDIDVPMSAGSHSVFANGARGSRRAMPSTDVTASSVASARRSAVPTFPVAPTTTTRMPPCCLAGPALNAST